MLLGVVDVVVGRIRLEERLPAAVDVNSDVMCPLVRVKVRHKQRLFSIHSGTIRPRTIRKFFLKKPNLTYANLTEATLT